MPSIRPSVPDCRPTSRACPQFTAPSLRRTVRAQLACQFVARQSRRCTQWCVYTLRPAGRASMSTLVGAPSLAHPPSSSPTLLISVSLILREGAGFTRYIVGVPKTESDAILGFLFAQINQNHQFQVRFKWGPNDVAIWDNRVRAHFPCIYMISSKNR